MIPQKEPLIVFYNTKCPVCDFGINAQKNKLLNAVKASTIEFRDINLETDALKHFSVKADDVRRRLHAVDQEGNLVVGADVAILLWRITPRQNWLASLLGNRLFLPVTRVCYNRFADLLFAWNKYYKRF